MSPADWRGKKANRNEALKMLRGCLAKDAALVLSRHMRLRMKQRGFSVPDVRNVLEQGKIIMEGEYDSLTQGWGYRIATGKMFVVFAFDETATRIVLITGQWLTSGRKL